MTELSAAAQAVLLAEARLRCFREWDHVNDPPCHPSDPGWHGCTLCVNPKAVAAVLRAVADQVVPGLGGPRTADELTLYHEGQLDAVIRHRDHILAIASELEGRENRAEAGE